MHKKCNIIHVCVFLGMQSLRIKVNPGVERGCIPLYLDKEPFWDSYKKVEHFIWTFLLQIQNWISKKKKKKDNPFFLVGKGQTNIYFF